MTGWTRRVFEAEGYGRRYPWVDLVNSVYPDGFGDESDCLEQETWRVLFLSAWNLRPPAQSAFPTDAFKALRATLRASITQIVTKGALSASAIESLNSALNERVIRSIRRTKKGCEMALCPERWSWQWVKAEIVASFGDFLSSEQAERLKFCANPLCRWLFYDETKAGTKRWCDARRCGNRDKVRRYRAKRGVS